MVTFYKIGACIRQVNHTRKDQMFLNICWLLSSCFSWSWSFLWNHVIHLCEASLPAWLFYLKHLSPGSGCGPRSGTPHITSMTIYLRSGFIFLCRVIYLGCLPLLEANYSPVFLFQIKSDGVFLNLYPLSE